MKYRIDRPSGLQETGDLIRKYRCNRPSILKEKAVFAVFWVFFGSEMSNNNRNSFFFLIKRDRLKSGRQMKPIVPSVEPCTICTDSGPVTASFAFQMVVNCAGNQ